MPLIIFPRNTYSSAEAGGTSSDGHSHSNINALNKLSIDTNGNLCFDGQNIAANSVEISYSTILSEQNITHCSLELPLDCDTSRAITFSLQGLSFTQGKDWKLIEHSAPVLDVISWENLALQSIAQQGDLVSITYYKKP